MPLTLVTLLSVIRVCGERNLLWVGVVMVALAFCDGEVAFLAVRFIERLVLIPAL